MLHQCPIVAEILIQSAEPVLVIEVGTIVPQILKTHACVHHVQTIPIQCPLQQDALLIRPLLLALLLLLLLLLVLILLLADVLENALEPV